MIGFEITLKDTRNKGFYFSVAAVAENEEQAIGFAKKEVGEHCEVIRVEEVKKGVIMTDSFYE